MKRVPLVFAVVLLLMWLLLNNTLAAGQIVMGALLAVALLLAAARMRPLQPRLRRPDLLVRLIFNVLIDVVRSNIAVSRVILGLAGKREVRSGFIDVPLELRDPHGLAALGMILTSTPGTIWVDLSPDGKTLTIHVLDLLDESRWVRMIKQRYERPLLEIFNDPGIR
jgi:multicomponent K+:H+ antiporter subunit E